MNDLQRRLCELLKSTAERLLESRLPSDAAMQMQRLASQVDQPCEVAVVGRVKAGKSTFINALLGAEDELAKVGVTETTATINYFRYGHPDPAKPVRCYWRDGSDEYVTREFLNNLQGNNLETLRLATKIDRLEYILPNRYLEQGIVLVDTPGLGAAGDSGAIHQDRTAEYLHLSRQLRQRHEQETKELDGNADAVIYLIGEVAGGDDRAYLDEFGTVTQGRSRAYNAIGVMARIDQLPDLLLRRQERSAKVAHQLEQHLNTVIPVSGGLEFAIHRLGGNSRAGLRRLAAAFSRVPANLLDDMLRSDLVYLSKPCPLSLEEREKLLDNTIPWTVFTTIARKVAVPGADLNRVEEELADLAGFRPLKETLERHFFCRGTYLRCARIANECRTILFGIRFHEVPKLKERDREEQAQRSRFLSFIREVGGNRDVARELQEFVTRVCGVARRAERLESDLRQWMLGLDRICQSVEQHNADFAILKLLDQYADLFTAEERGELRPLFGHYGFDNKDRLRSDTLTLEQIGQRQQHWHQLAIAERSPIRAQVAERAMMRYGFILNEMDNRM